MNKCIVTQFLLRHGVGLVFVVGEFAVGLGVVVVDVVDVYRL